MGEDSGKENCRFSKSAHSRAGTAYDPLVRSQVTAEDLDHAIQLAVATLRDAPAVAWRAKAGSLDWTCWETVEHISDDLFSYAVQLGLKEPPSGSYVPFLVQTRRSGGPEAIVFADPEAGPEGLLQVLEASGALLVAMVRTTPAHVRAHHPSGAADPEGFAAMGIVEVLVHMNDVAQGLGLTWAPPGELCARVLARLFPHVRHDQDPWATLLWATGRGELPGRPRLTDWRWYGSA